MAPLMAPLMVEQQECASSCGHLQKVIKTPGSKGVFLLLHPSNIKLVLVLFSMCIATLIRRAAAWQVFPCASRLAIAVCSRARASQGHGTNVFKSSAQGC